jgi:hypothetical protein
MSYRNVELCELHGVTPSQQIAIRPCPGPVYKLPPRAAHTYLLTTRLPPRRATHCARLGPDTCHIGAGPPPPTPLRSLARAPEMPSFKGKERARGQSTGSLCSAGHTATVSVRTKHRRMVEL